MLHADIVLIFMTFSRVYPQKIYRFGLNLADRWRVKRVALFDEIACGAKNSFFFLV